MLVSKHMKKLLQKSNTDNDPLLYIHSTTPLFACRSPFLMHVVIRILTTPRDLSIRAAQNEWATYLLCV